MVGLGDLPGIPPYLVLKAVSPLLRNRTLMTQVSAR
jgi:hypothetical protein